MNELKRIEEELVHTMEGDSWHGPAVLETLSDVDATKASARPIKSGHTIWEIVLHVGATIDNVVERIDGKAKQLTPEEDWPNVPTDPTDRSWRAAIDNLKESQRALINSLGKLDESRLDDPIVADFSSTYKTLQGLAQHNTYHAGQIAILKK